LSLIVSANQAHAQTIFPSSGAPHAAGVITQAGSTLEATAAHHSADFNNAETNPHRPVRTNYRRQSAWRTGGGSGGHRLRPSAAF
jgi:hypothetical protein